MEQAIRIQPHQVTPVDFEVVPERARQQADLVQVERSRDDRRFAPGELVSHAPWKYGNGGKSRECGGRCGDKLAARGEIGHAVLAMGGSE